jgi:hypothetical protein
MSFPQVQFRNYPFPYHAALAICSDLDNTTSLDIFLGIMDYLNSKKNTVLGRGLGIEVGNSFWFFNQTDSPQLTYFRGEMGSEETAFAPVCREMWLSGHIDVLHSYGNFDDGGFSRKFAEIACNEVVRRGARIETWVNHGGENNRQNIGFTNWCQGAVKGSSKYHADLMSSVGIRYAWMGRMTHVLGQGGKNSLNVKIINSIQRLLFSTKYRRYKEFLFDKENRLMREVRLQDDTLLWDFQRWVNTSGRQSTMDVGDLIAQLKPANINRLVANEGALVVYTHMCEGIRDLKGFPVRVLKNLQHIARRFHDGILLVTTTTRLLKYAEMVAHVNYGVRSDADHIHIEIEPRFRSLGKLWDISEDDVQGLTFYCDEPEHVRMWLGQKEISCATNPSDTTGRPSVSIPWRRLEYPRN